MGIIKQLPEDIAIKIAAGEVVERPASVVKELMENAIDAGATQIDVSLKDGGKTLIEVKDNGTGMDRDDAQAAFLRHGTSKIQTADDLASVMTLGFRGEALAAIGASAVVELTTTQRETASGTSVTVEYGAVQAPKPHPPLPGTTMRVTNLFESLPVRQKFLKSAVTEWKSCLDIITKQLLAHPEIGFLIKHNDRVVLDVQAGQSFPARVAAIWKVSEDQLVEVQAELPHHQLLGVVGKPELAHTTPAGVKSRQFLAVNGHPINDKMLMRALREAFGSLLPPNMQPTYALNLQIHPGMVDVNIHPRKDEVRFVNSQEVYRFVLSAVSQALEKSRLDFSEPFGSSMVDAPVEKIPSYSEPSYGPSPARFSDVTFSGPRPPLAEQRSEPSFSMPFSPVAMEMQSAPNQTIMVIDNCFLVTKHDGKLLVIDQHAAHERILYNQIWARDTANPLPKQSLLIPVPLDLSEADTAVLNMQRASFEELGFGFADENGGLVLTSVPQLVRKKAPLVFLREVLHGLDEDRTEPDIKTTKHKFYATMACKAAVKAGDVLDESEKQHLIHDLLTLPDIFTCPHGRPTHIEITGGQLEKLFKRTGF